MSNLYAPRIGRVADAGYVDALVLGGRTADDGRRGPVARLGGGGRGVVGAAPVSTEKNIIK